MLGKTHAVVGVTTGLLIMQPVIGTGNCSVPDRGGDQRH